jgi:hypothetical protein
MALMSNVDELPPDGDREVALAGANVCAWNELEATSDLDYPLIAPV